MLQFSGAGYLMFSVLHLMKRIAQKRQAFLAPKGRKKKIITPS